MPERPFRTRSAGPLGLAFATLLVATAPSPVRHAASAAAAAASTPAAAAADASRTAPARTGTLVGRVEGVAAPRGRRVAERYLGAESARARAVQPMPVVAYIEGVGAARPASPVRIAQQDTAFVPAIIVVPVGATVEFPNRDPFFHNVFSYSSPKRFDLGRFPRGESRSVRLDEAGVIRIYCEVHEFMRAVAIVAREPAHAIVGDDGRFTLRDVPVGRHRLTVWHPERPAQELTVDITAGSTTSVTVRFE